MCVKLIGAALVCSAFFQRWIPATALICWHTTRPGRQRRKACLHSDMNVKTGVTFLAWAVQRLRTWELRKKLILDWKQHLRTWILRKSLFRLNWCCVLVQFQHRKYASVCSSTRNMHGYVSSVGYTGIRSIFGGRTEHTEVVSTVPNLPKCWVPYRTYRSVGYRYPG